MNRATRLEAVRQDMITAEQRIEHQHDRIADLGERGLHTSAEYAHETLLAMLDRLLALRNRHEAMRQTVTVVETTRETIRQRG